MKPEDNISLRESFRCAARGLRHILHTERNARIHVVAALGIILVSLWLGLTLIEWALIVTAITLVFVGEMLNTVVERLVDLTMLAPHPLACQAKDVAAGAVLSASVASAVLGILILGPPLWQRVTDIFG